MDKIKESLVFVVVVVLTVLFLHLVALFFEKKGFSPANPLCFENEKTLSYCNVCRP